jgi:hypothetical protein
MEQPSSSNERLSSISLVNVDDFHTNCQEMTTRNSDPSYPTKYTAQKN